MRWKVTKLFANRTNPGTGDKWTAEDIDNAIAWHNGSIVIEVKSTGARNRPGAHLTWVGPAEGEADEDVTPPQVRHPGNAAELPATPRPGTEAPAKRVKRTQPAAPTRRVETATRTRRDVSHDLFGDLL